jgi:centromere protein B
MEDEKVEEEDWKKVSNQAVTFTEFVNCDNDVMTTVLLIVEDIGDAASEDKDVREKSDDLDEEQPVPAFGEAVAAFETVRRYMTSFPVDDVSMQ